MCQSFTQQKKDIEQWFLFLISTSAATSSYSGKPSSLVTATQHTCAIHDLKCSSSEKSDCSISKVIMKTIRTCMNVNVWKYENKTLQHDVKVKVAHDRNGEFLNTSWVAAGHFTSLQQVWSWSRGKQAEQEQEQGIGHGDRWGAPDGDSGVETTSRREVPEEEEEKSRDELPVGSNFHTPTYTRTSLWGRS